MKSISRFERHVDVPEIGIQGQKKLMASSVLIVGMGGLGCPAALYLAAAGIGTIGIVDDDVISLTNLQRQILYTEKDISQKKIDIAEKNLKKISSFCDIKKYHLRADKDNIKDLLQQYDIILDCTDNFETRFLLNSECFLEKKPLISASLYHHDGQISVFKAYLGSHHPCYECLYYRALNDVNIPRCSESGIVGPVAGIIGSMQASTTINELLNIGKSLSGWMVMFSSLNYETQKVKINKRKDCAICSPIAKSSYVENIYKAISCAQ